MGQQVSAEDAVRELHRRGSLGRSSDRTPAARDRAVAEGTFGLSGAALASIARIVLPAGVAGRHSVPTIDDKFVPSESGPQPGSSTEVEFTVRLPDPFLWQAEALASWESQGRRGVIEAVTGSGKTAIGLFAAAEVLAGGKQVAVIVPTVALQEQWVASIRKAFPSAIVSHLGGDNSTHNSPKSADVVVAVVNSVRKRGIGIRRPGLLIADEVHRYGSQQNARALDEAFPRRMGLTATFERPDEGIKEYLTPFFGEVCFELGYRRAIADGVLAPFRVGLIPVDLSDSEMTEYESLSRTMGVAAAELEQHLGFRDPYAQFMKEVEILAEGGHGSLTWSARRYQSAVAKRRELLADTDARRNAFVDLIPLIRASGPTLVFAERIQQAHELAATLNGHGISAKAIHSGIGLADRRAILRSFGTESIKAVTAPRVLDEGIDVPEADLAVVVSATRTRRQMIQRMGRVIRRKIDGREARLVLLYARNTTEDPNGGAHELFLDEVREAASALHEFQPGWQPEEVVSWFLSTADELDRAETPRKPELAPKPATVRPAPVNSEPEDEIVEVLVEEFKSSHQIVSKAELRELRRVLPGWLKQFRVSTLRKAIKTGPTIRDVAEAAGRIRAGIRTHQGSTKKATQLSTSSSKRTKLKKSGSSKSPPVRKNGSNQIQSKPNSRDRWVARKLGWEPQRVRNLRAIFHQGREAGSRPKTATESLARKLQEPIGDLDAWFRMEIRADTKFKRRPSPSRPVSASKGPVNPKRPKPRHARRAKRFLTGSTAPQRVPTCNACGTPITANGKCGCS